MPITELRIEGLRTIERIRLPLDGLTVLIGDNGTGKSTILEACEILRRATGPRFMDELHSVHGGLTALLRQGASRLVLGVSVRPDAGTLEPTGDVEAIAYDLTLVPQGAFASIEERIRVRSKSAELPRVRRFLASKKPKKPKVVDGWVEVLRRSKNGVEFSLLDALVEFDKDMPYLATKAEQPIEEGDWGAAEALYIAQVLKNILVHLPFEVAPAWVARALDRKSALRTSALLTPASRLEKLGLNLASAYHALRNNFGREHWERTLEYLRLGLGERVEDIVTWADPGGGNIGLSVKLAGLDRPIPAAQISDGMLSYIAFVALFRLHAEPPSLVAFDEPDLHLHPQLLMRVLDMFEEMARSCPVLLATHSDRLLDGLTDPAKSVVLCELDERGATRLVRPDAAALAKWLERYRGIGDIRGAGHAASVLTKVEPG